MYRLNKHTKEIDYVPKSTAWEYINYFCKVTPEIKKEFNEIMSVKGFIDTHYYVFSEDLKLLRRKVK